MSILSRIHCNSNFLYVSSHFLWLAISKVKGHLLNGLGGPGEEDDDDDEDEASRVTRALQRITLMGPR